MDMAISPGQTTRAGGLGKVLTNTNHNNLTCYETKHKTSDVVWHEVVLQLAFGQGVYNFLP